MSEDELVARIHRLNMLRSHCFELIQAERGLRAVDPENSLLKILDGACVGANALAHLDLWTRELTEALDAAQDLR